MPNPEKFTAVAEITEHLSSSAAAVITEYRGLTVKQISDLRRTLGSETTYAVVKNTLTRRAVADAGVDLDTTLLTGPTAIAFVKGDAVEAAKGLRDFARANPLLVIKGGVLDGKALSATEISQIADLESREVLLSKVAGGLKALPTRAASLFQAPLSQMARLAKALEEKKPGDAGTAEATVAEVADPEVSAAEASAAEASAAEISAPEVSSAEVPADDSAAASTDAAESPAEPAE